MNLNFYATVDDKVEFFINQKGGETYKGAKGNWKTVEGPAVVDDIECLDADDFAAKSAAVKLLWPNAAVRFMQDKSLDIGCDSVIIHC